MTHNPYWNSWGPCLCASYLLSHLPGILATQENGISSLLLSSPHPFKGMSTPFFLLLIYVHSSVGAEKHFSFALSDSVKRGPVNYTNKDRLPGEKICFFIDVNIFMCIGASQEGSENPTKDLDWASISCLQRAINCGEVTRQREGGLNY